MRRQNVWLYPEVTMWEKREEERGSAIAGVRTWDSKSGDQGSKQLKEITKVIPQMAWRPMESAAGGWGGHKQLTQAQEEAQKHLEN